MGGIFALYLSIPGLTNVKHFFKKLLKKFKNHLKNSDGSL